MLSLALILYHQNNYSSSLYQLTPSLTSALSPRRSYNLLSAIHFQMQKYDGADKAIDKSIGYNDVNDNITHCMNVWNRIVIDMQQKRWQQAQGRLEMLLIELEVNTDEAKASSTTTKELFVKSKQVFDESAIRYQLSEVCCP